MATTTEVDDAGLLKPATPLPDTGWVALGAAAFVAIIHLAPAVGLGPGSLDGDLGIQFFLGGQTARGAIPLVDFEHTWNVGSWYFNALLQRVAGGDPSIWLYLWGRVFGPVLAAVTAIGVLYRLRLRSEWILIGAGSWLALSHVVHSKYAIPIVWVFVLLPTGRAVSLRRAVVTRALLAGVTMLCQVELAVLLGGGVMLFDLIGSDVWSSRPGPRAGFWRPRILRAAAVPIGAALALAIELGVYAWIGQPPGEILRQLFSNAAETAPGFNYGYPVFGAPSLRPKLFAASLLVAFIPLVWQRISTSTRLVACLHLAQALIAIRRPDPAHVDAATTLLGLLVVLIVHDLVTHPRQQLGRRPVVEWVRGHRLLGIGALVGGAAIIAVATVTAFSTDSLLAVAVPTVLLVAGAVLGSHPRAPTAVLSVGAAAVVTVVLLGSLGGGVSASLRSGDAQVALGAAASDLAQPLDSCTGGGRVAWIVPGPLPLYTELGITNPTPYTVFWYGFRAEQGRVRAMLDGGEIPAIVQVGSGWPESFGDLPDVIEQGFTPCASVPVATLGQPVTIWVQN